MKKVSKKLCIDCKASLSQKAIRCKNCFHKSTRGRKAWNSGVRIQKYCLDCKSPLLGEQKLDGE